MILSQYHSHHGPRRKPRASGDDPQRRPPRMPTRRVNPARAGMIPDSTRRIFMEGGKPRASGDDPAQIIEITVHLV